MRRPGLPAMLTKNPFGWPGPSVRQCYQESSRFAHPRLRRSAAHRGEKLTPYGGLENAVGNVNCPDMNEASGPFDVAVIGGGPAGLATAIALAQAGATTA